MAILPWASLGGFSWGHGLIFSSVNLVMKGVVFPIMILRAIRAVNIHRETTPLVGPLYSLVLGFLSLLLCLWAGGRMPLPPGSAGVFAVSSALFTMTAGLFLIVGRRLALTQVAGYLVMENGLFTLGASLLRNQPVLVELGVLLDVFAAVFVMGIIVFHINREFDHMDTDRMTLLKG